MPHRGPTIGTGIAIGGRLQPIIPNPDSSHLDSASAPHHLHTINASAVLGGDELRDRVHLDV
eukprot:6155709-Prymnesium_polylepis.1